MQVFQSDSVIWYWMGLAAIACFLLCSAFVATRIFSHEAQTRQFAGKLGILLILAMSSVAVASRWWSLSADLNSASLLLGGSQVRWIAGPYQPAEGFVISKNVDPRFEWNWRLDPRHVECNLAGPIVFLTTLTGILFLPRRARPGTCRSCGYDLTGTPAGRCSECGADFIRDELAASRNVQVTRLALGVVSCVAVITLAARALDDHLEANYGHTSLIHKTPAPAPKPVEPLRVRTDQQATDRAIDYLTARSLWTDEYQIGTQIDMCYPAETGSWIVQFSLVDEELDLVVVVDYHGGAYLEEIRLPNRLKDWCEALVE